MISSPTGTGRWSLTKRLYGTARPSSHRTEQCISPHAVVVRRFAPQAGRLGYSSRLATPLPGFPAPASFAGVRPAYPTRASPQRSFCARMLHETLGVCPCRCCAARGSFAPAATGIFLHMGYRGPLAGPSSQRVQFLLLDWPAISSISVQTSPCCVAFGNRQ